MSVAKHKKVSQRPASSDQKAAESHLSNIVNPPYSFPLRAPNDLSSMDGRSQSSAHSVIPKNDDRKIVSRTHPNVSQKFLDGLTKNDGFDANLFSAKKVSQSSLKPDEEILDNQKHNMKKVGELANLLLDMKKSLLLDSNIDPNLIPQNVYSSKNQGTSEAKRIHISRATSNRAERIKTMLSIYYIGIERIYEWVQQKEANYPGVEDVYNPLQIIRNRKIRKKYHEYPKPLSFKPIALASQVFSNRSSKLIWQVEIHEFVSDVSWRALHWHELRNPKGELWFPLVQHKRLHDRLFEDIDGKGEPTSEESEKSLMPTHRRIASHTQSFFTSHRGTHDSNNEEPSSSRFHRSRRPSSHSAERSRSTSRIREKSSLKLSKLSTPSKFFKKSSDSSSPSLNNDAKDDYFNSESEDSNSKYKLPNSENIPSRPILKVEDELGRTESIHEIRDVTIEPFDHKRTTSFSSNPSLIPNSNNLNSSANSLSNTNYLSPPALPISNTSRSESLDYDKEQPEGKKMSEKEELAKKMEEDDVKMYSYMQKLKDLRHRSYISLYSMEATIPQINKLLLAKPIDRMIPELYSSFEKIDNDLLLQYNRLFEGYNDEAEAIRKDLLNNHSAKLDTLLSISDRAIGELNTSSTLELRKLNERIERLDSSNLTHSTLSKIGYKVLENLIVILLWIAWSIVTIYKFFRFWFRLFWTAFKWLFGF